MAELLQIHGAPGSPYSRKLRAALRYRRIPHRWFLHGAPDAPAHPPVPVSLLPVLVFSPDEAAVDSTPLLRRLEAEYPGRALVPPDAALALVDALLEDYGDEWLTKAMFHYRWSYEADIQKAARILPLWRNTQMPAVAHARAGREFAARQIGRLGVVGSNETTRAAIEESYRRFLELFEAHLAAHKFLLGARPGCGDLALYGQLTQLAHFDPTPSAVALQTAPRVCAWVDAVEDLSGAPAPEGGWFARGQLPQTLHALLAEVGRVYAPYLLANAAALEKGAAEVQTTIAGRPWVQKPFAYQGKCLAALRAQYRALSAADRAAADAMLAGSGCEILF